VVGPVKAVARLLAPALVALAGCGGGERGGAPAAMDAATAPDPSAYAGSAGCAGCHDREWRAWASSHHARAERQVGAAERAAFAGAREVRHGSKTSVARVEDGAPVLFTVGRDGAVQPFVPARVIGVDPLWQLLIEAGDGRLQVTELAYDPARDEWFDVYGEEDRRPHEWGFWANRGMNWNSMCAACHNTALYKGYDARTDSYRTTSVEHGVGCEACHGPAAEHVEWQERVVAEGAAAPEPGDPGWSGDPTLARLSLALAPRLRIDHCGSCHARRSELGTHFQPGDPFLDAYMPEIPDLSDVYHADGQVRDEDFEYVSFLTSRMYAKDVTCTSCHDPHNARPVARGNELCMSCHGEAVSEAIAVIDPSAHSHHRLDDEGGQCVACHMPLTTYMQRHPRRDHGFTIPDPLLTRELGIPNACDRCHAERGLDWAVAAVEEWYGERTERPTRRRARLVARARAGDEGVAAELVASARGEPLAAWRAIELGLLSQWSDRPAARAALIAHLRDDSALVRVSAARALAAAGPDAARALGALLDDPLRAVRVAAAMSLQGTVGLESRAGQDLLRFLAHNADQPVGAASEGSFLLARGRTAEALAALFRAVEWDPSSPPLRHALAVALAAARRPAEAARQCEAACDLAPEDGASWYLLGLAKSEIGDLAGATAALARACELEPTFVRGWYNLGLAHNAGGDSERAIAALERACAVEPRDAESWFALAAVYRDAGRADQAQLAAREALRVAPRHPRARALLKSLEGRGGGR